MRLHTIATEESIARALREALPTITPTGAPRLVPKGYSSESWRVPTDAGPLLIKVRRERTDSAKLRSYSEAVTLAHEAGVPTPELLHAGLSPILDGRPLVVARYLPGIDAEVALPTLDPVQRRDFFAELGVAIGRLHLIALPQFTERLGSTAGATDDWAIAIRQNVDRYTAWVERLGCLNPSALATVHDNLVRQGVTVAPVVRPALTHRDLYPANFLVGRGRFAAILDFELAKGKDPLLDFVKLGLFVFEPWPESIEPLLVNYRRVVGRVRLPLERLSLCLALESLIMLPNWHQAGEKQLEDEARHRMLDWLDGRLPDWLRRSATILSG